MKILVWIILLIEVMPMWVELLNAPNVPVYQAPAHLVVVMLLTIIGTCALFMSAVFEFSVPKSKG